MSIRSRACTYVLVFALMGVLVPSVSAQALRDVPLPPDLAGAALDAAGDDDLATARRLANRASDGALLDKLVRWRWLTAPGSHPPFAALQEFLQKNPDWPRRRTLVRKAENTLPAWWKPDERVAWYNAHPPRTARAKVDRLLELAELGASEQLAGDLRTLWRTQPLRAYEEQRLQERLGELIARADEVARMTNMMDARAFDVADRAAERLGGAYPKLVTARRKLAQRAAGVDAAIRALPESLRGRPGLLYDRAWWRLRAGDLDGTVELLDQLEDEPKPERWWRIRHWVARDLMEDGRTAKAYEIAANHGLSEGIGFAEGEWLAGWLALTRMDRPEDAFEHFVRLHDGVSTPISRARGAYWAGRAAETLGRADTARGWYAVAGQHWTTYYGQLARGRLGSTVVPPHALSDARALQADAPDDPDLAEAARLLARHGQDRLADSFLYTLAARAEQPGQARAVADLAWSLDRPQVALWLGRQARGDGQVLADILFPRHPLLTERKHTALLHAIGRQESGFDPQARSRVGARGLLQLMPATAERTARSAGLPVSTTALTDDPAYNATLGALHIDDLIARFDGSRLLAIAAYNAGAARIEEWIDRFGDPRRESVDVVNWIEQIPFGETRNYVQRVIEGYNVYRQDLGDEPHLPGRLARADTG
ncbi:lytic transglycosylase domain-containing protein [Rhodovibrio salinarum]|uniref:lytic transglycosylase domain-containing protein n=1 Tax=Rhodovibrio salinarum TaxID=1087 RepID=UPI0012DFC999|nr:lytic transglycosylase domain-containing protein [Rhodovibrio salinarum]